VFLVLIKLNLELTTLKT